MPSTDEELARLAEQAVNPGAFSAPAAAPPAAPVIGTPEGPGVAPVANPEMPTAPVTPPVAVDPAAGVPPVQAQPRPVANLPGVDTGPLEAARSSADKVSEAQAAVGPLKSDALDAEAASIGQESEAKRNAAVEMSAEEQAQKDGLAAAKQVADDAQEEVKNFKFPDYWGDKTSVQKVRAHIGYALGAYAAGGSSGNGVNYAAEKIKMISDQNYKAAKEKLGTKQWAAEQARKGVTDLQQQYRDDLARLQMRQGMELQASADEAKAFLLQSKKPLAEAENNVLVQKLKSEGDAAYSKGFQDLVRDKAQLALEKARINAQYAAIGESRREHDLQHEDRVTGEIVKGVTAGNGKGSELTEGQAKANAFAKQMREAADLLNKLPEMSEEGKKKVLDYNAQQEFAEKNPGYNAALTTVGIRKPIEQILSPEDARVYSTQQRLLTPLLRSESGAAIGASEFSRRYRDLMPVPGDSPDVIKDKKAMLNKVIEGSTEAAGTKAPVNSSTGKAQQASTPNVAAIQKLSDSDRRDAIEATAALRDPSKREKATRFLRHLGVM